MRSEVIHVEHVSFAYGHEVILDDVSFDVHAGEFVGMIGPNGSGKTTLLKILLGLLKPTHGEVSIFGQTVQLGKGTNRIGYIPQKVTQSETRFPITVEEVVNLGLVSGGMFKSSFTRRSSALEALKTVDLLPFRRHLITDLSGGQQQRVFIAKALASQPELLILDEPTVGIDVESQEKFYALLAELHQKHNLTILIVSHDVDVVVNEVSSVLCLNKTLIYHGNPQRFMKEEYLEKLYGKNRKFILHGH